VVLSFLLLYFLFHMVYCINLYLECLKYCDVIDKFTFYQTEETLLIPAVIKRVRESIE